MKNFKLSRAIALVVSGMSLSTGAIPTASASTTMYNLYNNFGTTACAPCIGTGNGVGGYTDGWNWGTPDPSA